MWDVCFCPFIGHCSLAAISQKDSPTHDASNSRSPFSHLCTEKWSLFLPYPKQHRPLSPLIMVMLKMTYLETFQSDIIKNTNERYVDCKSRKENPQKLTQLSSRSHSRHLVGKRTAQKDITIDTTSDSQVNSNFPNRWSPASLTFNNYFCLFLYLYIT